ncbi:hypothetical protein Ocin01_17848, partial [Orchesella cincta]
LYFKMRPTSTVVPSYAAALSDSWNKPSSSTMAMSLIQQNSVTTSTCLFCPNIVFLSENGESEDTTKRFKVLMNLCLHMKLSEVEIPKNCKVSNFPFCTLCLSLVTDLWTHQANLEQIQKKIAKTVSAIEHIVADTEILGDKARRPSNSAFSNTSEEHNKFVKLRDMILDGYRKKLLRKQQQQETALMGNKFKKPAAVQKLKNLNNTNKPPNVAKSQRRVSLDSLTSSSAATVKREPFTDDSNSSNDSIDFEAEMNSPIHLSSPICLNMDAPSLPDLYGELDVDNASKNDDAESTATSWTLDPLVVANCTRIISNAEENENVGDNEDDELISIAGDPPNNDQNTTAACSSPIEKHINCRICNRKFANLCNLMRHKSVKHKRSALERKRARSHFPSHGPISKGITDDRKRRRVEKVLATKTANSTENNNCEVTLDKGQRVETADGTVVFPRF